MRLDLFIASKYSFTRNKAQAFIKDGLVSVGKKVVTKASLEVSGTETIELQEVKKIHWISRSAGKLDGFLEQLISTNHQLGIIDTHCLDVGSSTGGFTQVLLERGANHVDAVDVGTDQLHETLRSDHRVTSYEQTDIRDFESEAHYNIIVCDASFISLQEIFPSILKFTNQSTHIILLWKPQFEVGREHLRKTGVPKDEKIVTKRQKEWEEFVSSHNCEILQKEKSTVIGEAGNKEWMYFIQKS